MEKSDPILRFVHYPGPQQAPVLLAFHGFGQSPSVFAPLSARYEVYAFWLPGHQPECLEGAAYRQAWMEEMRRFLALYARRGIYLLGYSIGARAVLLLIQYCQVPLLGVWLLAPEGISPDPWLWAATGPLHLPFRLLMQRDIPLTGAIDLLKDCRLLDKGTAKLAHSQVGTQALKRRVYETWSRLGYFKSDLGAVAQKMAGCPLTVVLGRLDGTITQKSVAPLLRLLPQTKLQWLPCGHAGVLTGWRTAHLAENTNK